MYPVVYKRALNSSVTLMKIRAPLVAQKAKAGQFIILRVNETGERIPLTVAETDPAAGTVTIIFQKVGKTTLLLDTLNVGDALLDFVGPLGRASEVEGFRHAAVMRGRRGLCHCLSGGAALHDNGAKVDMTPGSATGI